MTAFFFKWEFTKTYHMNLTYASCNLRLNMMHIALHDIHRDKTVFSKVVAREAHSELYKTLSVEKQIYNHMLIRF